MWNVDGTLTESGRNGHRAAFNLALEELGLPWRRDAEHHGGLPIEDAPGGVAAARAAQGPVIVTRSATFAQDTVEHAIAIGPGLHTREGWRPAPAALEGARRVRLDDVRAWHARMELVSDLG